MMKTYLVLFTIVATCGMDTAGSAVEARAENVAFKPYSQGETDNPIKARMGMPKKDGGFVREGYHLWDSSIIKVGDTYHMFASCWPDDNFHPDWMNSFVIRAMSKNLFGPYTYVEDVLLPRPGKYFDSQGCHNPKIIFHKGTYYLYHLGIAPATWKSGVAVSDSVEGPWKRMDTWCIPLNNPALWIHEDGSVYGFGKVKISNPKYKNSKKFNKQLHYLHAVKAGSIYGPYTQLHEKRENALPENFENEDPCVLYDGSRYHILVKDLHGYATGLYKVTTYFTSEDGLKYKLVSKDPLFSPCKPIRFSDGSEVDFRRVERPNIVLNRARSLPYWPPACRMMPTKAVRAL